MLILEKQIEKPLMPLHSFKTKSKADLKRLQQKETIKRYQFINDTLKKGQTIDLKTAKDLRIKLDRILTHKVWGYLIFGIILLTIFQAIYDWSSVPMDFIDSTFASLSEWTKTVLPSGAFTNLLQKVLFLDLVVLLFLFHKLPFYFLFISVLEESGYMSRVVFLMDRIMRRFGLKWKKCCPT